MTKSSTKQKSQLLQRFKVSTNTTRIKKKSESVLSQIRIGEEQHKRLKSNLLKKDLKNFYTKWYSTSVPQRKLPQSRIENSLIFNITVEGLTRFRPISEAHI